jgi:hypothetical protein
VPLAVEARDTVDPVQTTTPLDATRVPQATEFLLEEPKDRRPSASTAAAAGVAAEPINAASALQHRARSPSPREDHGTQTEHQQLGQQQSNPQSTMVPSNAATTTSSAWALASTEAFLEKTPLTPPQHHHHHSHQVLARPRPLPMFTIPPHDDEIQFAGPPQIQQWADDRDPAFVSAIVTHRPGAHRDVIPQAEFRKMIVSGSPSSAPQSQDASRPVDSNASKQQNAPLTAGTPSTLPQQPLIPITSSRSASAQPLVNPTYHTFQEEFPVPPPPPTPKATTTCSCWSYGRRGK